MGNINGHYIASIVVDIANKIYDKINISLDFVSYHLCPDRPTNKLATDNLQIPAQDLRFLEKIGEFVHEVLALCIMPVELIINKKFSIHMFESSSVFALPNNQPVHNLVTTCEKMLIYIGQNKNKITDPPHQQIIKTVSIDNKDYDIPVNFWYKFQIDVNAKIYFYVHCSTLSNYKGVVIAVNANNVANLSLMKDTAINFYNQTMGVPVVAGNGNGGGRENFI